MVAPSELSAQNLAICRIDTLQLPTLGFPLARLGRTTG